MATCWAYAETSVWIHISGSLFVNTGYQPPLPRATHSNTQALFSRECGMDVPVASWTRTWWPVMSPIPYMSLQQQTRNCRGEKLKSRAREGGGEILLSGVRAVGGGPPCHLSQRGPGRTHAGRHGVISAPHVASVWPLSCLRSPAPASAGVSLGADTGALMGIQDTLKLTSPSQPFKVRPGHRRGEQGENHRVETTRAEPRAGQHEPRWGGQDRAGLRFPLRPPA